LRLKTLLLAASLAFLVALFPAKSSAQTGQPPRPLPPPLHQPTEDDEQEQAREKEQTKRLNRERQAQIKRDTGDLLKMATELKLYVDKSNENILSVDVIRKADEIERLAHEIKEKMKAN